MILANFLQFEITSKSLQITSDGQDVERREPSCTVGGNVNWCSHCAEQDGASLNTKNRTTICSSNSTPGHI